MQQDRYSDPRTCRRSCHWCLADYRAMSSRASDPLLFCTKRCEIEARFWLLDQMNEAIRLRRDTDPPHPKH